MEAIFTVNGDMLTIRLLERGDINEAAHVLSVAMLNNPIHVAVLQGNGERQRARIEKMFSDLFVTFPGVTFIAQEGAKIVGVMRMKSCCGSQPPDHSEKAGEEDAIGRRIAFLYREWALNDPVEQHWHLGPIGVLPSHRKQGIGTAFMRIFCKEVDKCLATAFLETDSDENVRFYKRFGFEIVLTSTIFGTESRYMARAAAM